MRKVTWLAASVCLAFAGCNHSGGGGNGGQASTATPLSTAAPIMSAAPVAPTPVATRVAPAPPPSTLTANPSDPHLAFALALLNADRASVGAPPLLLDLSTTTCSLRHSQDLYGCAGHDLTKLGQSFPVATGCAHLDWRNGDTCGASAENQGVSELPDEDQAFQQVNDMMMAEGAPAAGSSNHYSNIVNLSWTSVGIGLYEDPDGWLWVTEDFK